MDSMFEKAGGDHLGRVGESGHRRLREASRGLLS